MDTPNQACLGEIVVIKIGGRALERNLDGLVESITRASRCGKIILIHGGGDQVTRVSKALGIEPRFVTSPQGIRSRYTSKEELEVFIMVMSLINKSIVTSLVKRGIRAIGIAGCDGPILEGVRKKQLVIIDERGRKRVIEGGYTGSIGRCHRERLLELLKISDVVVVSPLAIDIEEGVLLNVDGDEAAASIARCIEARGAIFVTDVPGVIIDGNVVREIRESDKEILGKIGAGMNRKVMAALKYVGESGGKAYICDGTSGDVFEKALNGECTVITKG